MKKIVSRWPLATALAAALAASACNQAPEPTGNATAMAAVGSQQLPDLPATLPLVSGGQTALQCAPATSALPQVRPVRAVRVADARQSYAYADRAYGFDQALGTAPPDYGFDYDGARPWAWQSYDDSAAFAEPIDDGAYYRTYYYRPGAAEPYFVRDRDYGYGFDNGQLAAVYGPDGRVVPWADYGPQLVYASIVLTRGRDLWAASRHRREAVIAANWAGRQQNYLADRERWYAARDRQAAWQDYRQAYAVDRQAHWQEERLRRAADASRFQRWQQADFRTPPPPRAIPPQWANARWARDERRFAPVQAAYTPPPRQDPRDAMALDRRGPLPDGRDRPGMTPGGFDRAALEQQQAATRAQQRAAFDAQRAQQQAARGQAAGPQQALREQARAQQQQAQAQRFQAQAAARDQARAARVAERQQGAAADVQARMAARQQAQQARLAERQQAQAQAGQFRARDAERQQAQAARAAQRQQAQATQLQARGAERQQAQAARAAERQQAQAAQSQARDAARQQARSAERQQAQAAQLQARGAERQQAQAARPERAAPGPRPGGGGDGGPHGGHGGEQRSPR